MDINTSKLRALTNLSDEDFSKIIYTIALSMGFTPQKADQASKNTAFFRVLINSASESDLQNMINKVGSDKLEGIYSSLPKNDLPK